MNLNERERMCAIVSSRCSPVKSPYSTSLHSPLESRTFDKLCTFTVFVLLFMCLRCIDSESMSNCSVQQ